MTTPKQKIFSLHRYYLWANRMRTHFDEILARAKTDKEVDPEHIERFMYMSFWYGELYTVIEGWRELKLKDKTVDALLADSDMVELLRRYRNGSFHYQSTYFDDRFIDFMKMDDSAEWIRKLNKALGAYFLSSLNTEGVS
jgi:hypothetical protein